MSVKLVHTSDLRLDAGYADLVLHPEVARRRRERLREVFAGIVRHAKTQNAAALLISGNLFVESRLTPDTLAFIQDTCAQAAPLPILIAPGWTDPYSSSSVYARNWPGNVIIFAARSWTAYALEDTPLIIHGCGLGTKPPAKADFGGLVCPADGRLHAAMTCALDRAAAAQPGAPRFSSDELMLDGLHYLALGGRHATMSLKNVSGATAYYSGAPEGHSFDESGPHFFLDVAIKPVDDSANVVVQPIPSAKTIFSTYTVDCSTYFTLDELAAAVRALAGDGQRDAITRVRLTGEPAPAVRGELERVHGLAYDAFAHLEIDLPPFDMQSSRKVTEETTAMGAYTRRMLDYLRDAPDAARRATIERALEVGAAALRERDLPVRGIEDGTA
ncbi:MAG: hypothetical protein GC168_09800 [Candidatus Hydrogenedens sp.]|nr:hypothetical protein [Candidatus Hydrogenedens sp.]